MTFISSQIVVRMRPKTGRSIEKKCQNTGITYASVHADTANSQSSQNNSRCVLTDVASIVKTVEDFVDSEGAQVVPERK